MVDNSIALGIQTPQIGSFNPLQAALVASQIRAADNQNSLAQVQLQNAPAFAASQLRAADTQNSLAQAQLQKSPLELDAARMDVENKKIETARLRDAEDGIRVLSLPAGPIQDAELKKVLDKAVAEGRTDPAHRDAILAMPAEQRNDLLQKKVTSSLSPQQYNELLQRQQGTKDVGAALKPAEAAPSAPSNYFTTLKAAESANNPAATPPVDPKTGKPASTAAGLFQITKGTWDDVAAKYPDLELTPEARTGTDAASVAKQEKAVKALTADNASTLIKSDVAPTEKNLYVAHFLGGDGAVKFLDGLKANPNAPATSLVDAEAVKANPTVFLDSAGQPKTARGVFNSLTAKFGGSGQTTMDTGAERSDAVARLLTNPAIDGNVKQMVLGQLSPSFGFQTLPDGTVVRTNPKNGGVEPVYQSSKPSFSVIGKDQNGNDVHGYVDVVSKKTFDINGNPIDTAKLAGMNQPSSDLTGEDFLKTLDTGRANQIKAIVEGRMPPPGGMSLKSPQIQGLLRDVAQYEPGFDLTSWKARESTRKDLSSGKMGQNVTAFNTAIGHLETLDKAADGLGNRWSPAWNTVANMTENAIGDPRVKKFEIAKTAVVDELTRAFRGSGGNVHDLVQWENAISSSGSPEQLKSAIKQAVELLRSRIEAVGDQYNRGMGKTTDPLELLTPKAKAGIQRLSGEAEPEKKLSPAGTMAPTVEPPAGFRLVN